MKPVESVVVKNLRDGGVVKTATVEVHNVYMGVDAPVLPPGEAVVVVDIDTEGLVTVAASTHPSLRVEGCRVVEGKGDHGGTVLEIDTFPTKEENMEVPEITAASNVLGTFLGRNNELRALILEAGGTDDGARTLGDKKQSSATGATSGAGGASTTVLPATGNPTTSDSFVAGDADAVDGGLLGSRQRRMQRVTRSRDHHGATLTLLPNLPQLTLGTQIGHATRNRFKSPDPYAKKEEAESLLHPSTSPYRVGSRTPCGSPRQSSSMGTAAKRKLG